MAAAEIEASHRKIWGLHHNVFFTGMTSLLNDISSEMIFNLIPLFLLNVLGASGAIVGLVGGLSEGADAIFRMLSGWLSDKLGKRKVLAATGYSLSTVAKPFLALADAWGAVLAVRFTDRLGKGIRSSSRDALIADSVSAQERGRAFGLHRAMDTTGAFLGLILAVIIVGVALGAETVKLSRPVFQWLALASAVPALLGVILLLVFVHDIKKNESPNNSSRFPLDGVRGRFSRRFWVFMGILAVFSLGSMPHNYFVILRAQDLGTVQTPLLQVLLMLVLFNAVYAIAAFPMGVLSDRLGRRRVIALGWFVYTVVYTGFALASTVWQVWLAYAFLGIYAAIVEGVSRAFVADLAPAELRGTAYGLYYCVIGITVLVGGVIGGIVWDAISPEATFYFGAGLAFLAMLGILTLVREPAAAAKPG